jgi:hypothetical protein
VNRIAITLSGTSAFGAALLLAMSTQTFGQAEAPRQAPAVLPADPAKSAPASTPQPSARRVQVPMDQALLLVRSTLLSLNDANRSGNYSVLRDLGSPEFQARNTAADLSIVFSEMRKSNLSLLSVLLLSPQLTSSPELDSEGRLRVSGFVPMRPQQVKFDLIYSQSGGQWKLLNLGISTTQEESQTSERQAQPQQKPSPKPEKPPPIDPRVGAGAKQAPKLEAPKSSTLPPAQTTPAPSQADDANRPRTQ